MPTADRERTVASTHDPPEVYRYNKLRTTGGSSRLTLVKAAVDRADVDPRPPRLELAHLPAAPGVWLALDVARYPAQTDRVAVRSAVSEAIETEGPIVGEFPVTLQGKLGSAVTLVPSDLVDRIDLESGTPVTTVALGPGALLLVAADVVEGEREAVGTAIEWAREAVAG